MKDTIDDNLLKKIAPAVSPQLRAEYVKYFNAYCSEYKINTQLRLAAFFANIMVESGRLTRTQENLNYSAQRLMQVWPKRFPTAVVANKYAHNPQDLANYVYNGRNGNRPNTDDGWKYRGGGFGQETGRGNYKSLGDEIGVDLESNPDYLRTPQGAIQSACAGWSIRGCNSLADKRQITATRQAINGGTNGLADAKAFYSSCLQWIPEEFILAQTNLDQDFSSDLASNELPLDNDHVPDSASGVDQGSPAWVDASDTATSNASDNLGQDIQPTFHSDGSSGQGTGQKPPPDPQVIKKETPSTFVKWLVAIKVAIGTALTGLTAFCSSNDIAKTVSQKAADQAVTNVDQSFVVHMAIVLVYTLIGVGAGVFLMFIASRLWDRSAARATAINSQKMDIASNGAKATVEFTNDRSRTTAIEQAKT